MLSQWVWLGVAVTVGVGITLLFGWIADRQKMFVCRKHQEMGLEKPISAAEFDRDVYGWCDECTRTHAR